MGPDITLQTYSTLLSCTSELHQAALDTAPFHSFSSRNPDSAPLIGDFKPTSAVPNDLMTHLCPETHLGSAPRPLALLALLFRSGPGLRPLLLPLRLSSERAPGVPSSQSVPCWLRGVPLGHFYDRGLLRYGSAQSTSAAAHLLEPLRYLACALITPGT